MSRNEDGKHHRVRDRSAEADFETWAGQYRCALTLGIAVGRTSIRIEYGPIVALEVLILCRFF
jgi:hypothetical protein